MEALSAHVIFQVGDEEIRDSAQAPLLKDARPWFELPSSRRASCLWQSNCKAERRQRLLSGPAYSQFAREIEPGSGNAGVCPLPRDRHRASDARLRGSQAAQAGRCNREVLSRVSLIREHRPIRSLTAPIWTFSPTCR